MKTATATKAAPLEDIEWDERQRELDVARDDSATPAELRDALRALLVHAEAFNGWTTSDEVAEEWQMNAVLGSAEEAEIRVCMALRAWQAGGSMGDVLSSIAACRAVYVDRMARGVPAR